MESQILTEADLKVFNGVKIITIEPEFREAQMTFVEANCRKFDSTEENKLEYTEIHNEYLKITENILEAQIKERFQVTEDEMIDFYSGFKDKFKLYEAQSSDTVDVLFSLLDFARFKELMLEAKGAATAQPVESNLDQMTKEIDSTKQYLGTTYEEFMKIYNEDLSTWKHKLTQNEKQFNKQGFKLDVYQRKQ